jgi:hypothetical protein
MFVAAPVRQHLYENNGVSINENCNQQLLPVPINGNFKVCSNSVELFPGTFTAININVGFEFPPYWLF